MKKILSKIKFPKAVPKTELTQSLITNVSGAFNAVTGTFDTGMGLIRSTLGDMPFIGATATSKVYDHTEFDEKHYFLIPDPKSQKGFSFYVMRCLPAGIPPINDLPKRRLLHLPNEHALPMLQNIVIEDAKQTVKSKPSQDSFIKENLTSLINEIDEIDDKAFKGVLLLGGLVALANPLAGGTIAMKAMVPALGLTLSKYGLQFASQTATNIEISNEIRRAEKDIKKQFKASSTISLINPLLHHLNHQTSSDMWMAELELFQFKCPDIDFSQADKRRLLELSRQAISDVIEDEIPEDYFKRMEDIILFQ